jgi:hypothetical protein
VYAVQVPSNMFGHSLTVHFIGKDRITKSINGLFDWDCTAVRKASFVFIISLVHILAITWNLTQGNAVHCDSQEVKTWSGLTYTLDQSRNHRLTLAVEIAPATQ